MGALVDFTPAPCSRLPALTFPIRLQAFTYVDTMVHTILAGGPLAPMQRLNPTAAYGASPSASIQSVDSIMMQSEQAYIKRAVSEGQIIPIVAYYR